MLNHNEVVAVEEDSRDVTEDKHKDNADEDESKVDLFLHTTGSWSKVGESEEQEIKP